MNEMKNAQVSRCAVYAGTIWFGYDEEVIATKIDQSDCENDEKYCVVESSSTDSS